MITNSWTGCYRRGWGRELVPEAYSHPAKISFSLAERIYRHIIEEGWVVAGSKICDPFGGIAGTAYHALLRGLCWTGVELEPRFVALGQQNIDAWNARYAARLPGYGTTARLLQGDSRNLAQVVSVANLCLSSPPYESSDQNYKAGWARFHATRAPLHKNDIQREAAYGNSEGQLGQMRAGEFAAAVRSPPWDNGAPPIAPERVRESHSPGDHGAAGPAYVAMPVMDNFWSAAAVIVAQTYAVLAPGGHACWVVKSFVRNKQIVDFPGQWRALCEAAGFVTLHEHHALLTEPRGTQLAHDGQHKNKDVARKSFFRRLAEKKGSPAIDYEVVLCMSKPDDGSGGTVAATISSPPFGNAKPFQDKEFRLNDGRKSLPQGIDGYGHTPGQLGAMPAGDPPAAPDGLVDKGVTNALQ